jgi:uncharacterized protein YlzI (FlbEa/FlbD family)
LLTVAGAAVLLIELTGLRGQKIEINPAEITSIHNPNGDHLVSKDVRCIVFTADGKFVSVRETCTEVIEQIVRVSEGD